MADMSQFLDQDMSTIERPPTLPEGEYDLIITKYEYGQSRQKKTPQVEFQFQVAGARDSVDADELAKVDLSKAKLRSTFYLTEDSLFRMKEFFENIGHEGGTLRECIESSQGVSLVGVVGHRAATDGSDKVYADLVRFSAA